MTDGYLEKVVRLVAQELAVLAEESGSDYLKITVSGAGGPRPFVSAIALDGHGAEVFRVCEFPREDE